MEADLDLLSLTLAWSLGCWAGMSPCNVPAVRGEAAKEKNAELRFLGASHSSFPEADSSKEEMDALTTLCSYTAPSLSSQSVVFSFGSSTAV